MLLGYNTNGLAHHRLADAIHLLGDEGYKSLAITLDAGVLDPYGDTELLARQKQLVRDLAAERGFSLVIETGARFLLNPRRKHDPTLLNADQAGRAFRIDFLKRSIDIARDVDASCVSFWSGALRDDVSEEVAMERLVSSLQPVLRHAEEQDMRLAFEPEPGMFIDTFDRFARLDERIAHPLFDLTVDLGHVHCIEEGDVAHHVRRWGSRIANIHIEDMKKGIHEHLMFGEGTLAFPPIFEALREIRYEGGLHVELSRHSHMAVEAVRQARDFLAPLLAVG